MPPTRRAGDRGHRGTTPPARRCAEAIHPLEEQLDDLNQEQAIRVRLKLR